MQEAIILAGGKGTRLQAVVKDVPKPMALIGEKPFLEYQLEFLRKQGVTRFILSVGYLHTVITSYFGDNYKGIPIVYVIEEVALGTGGGIKLAIEAAETENVLVCNGDTFCDFNLKKLNQAHNHLNSKFSFCLISVYNTGRYGGVEVKEDATIKGFVSKNVIGECSINAGSYIINKAFFLEKTSGLTKFSLEDDFFNTGLASGDFFGVPFKEVNFLDIGIPEDYSKGQTLIPEWVLKAHKEYKSIFLDRDGVINKKIDNGYVLNRSQFEYLPGALEWIAEHVANDIIIITNQRGVGRGLMSKEDIDDIHSTLKEDVLKKGGKITDDFYCPDVNADSPNRKPNPGMINQALEKYSHIKKEESILIGDSLTDLQAAKNAGIDCAFIDNNNKLNLEVLNYANYVFSSLAEVNLFR